MVSAAPPSAPRDVDLDGLFEEAVERGNLKLPVLSEVARQAREEATKPNTSALGLAQIIERDAALSARVLKLANSAMYAALREIRDLRFAIARVGSGMVVSIVIGAASKETFQARERTLDAILRASWKRSVLLASLARRLAPALSIDREQAFVAGLLHAAGEPILVDLLLRVRAERALPLPAREEVEGALARHRAPACRRLFESWMLPAFIAEAVFVMDAAPLGPRPLDPISEGLGGVLAEGLVAARALLDQAASSEVALELRSRFAERFGDEAAELVDEDLVEGALADALLFGPLI